MPHKTRLYRKNFKAGLPAWITATAVLIFGILLLIWPGMTTGVILNACGIALIAAGLYNIIRYFLRKTPSAAFSWELCLGLLLTIGGVSLIAFKAALLSIVPLLFGLGLIISGIVKLQAAFNMRRMLANRWYITLVFAIISIALGTLVVLHPFGTGLVLIRFIGGALVVESAQDLLAVRSYKKTVSSYFVD